MESKAKLLDLSKDWDTGKMRMLFLVDEPVSEESLENLSGDVRLTAVKWREKRSLRANAYYWELCGKTARKMKISSSRLHNLMLRDFGKPHIIDGKIVTMILPDTEQAEEVALESETFHIKPTTDVFENSHGTAYRSYIVLEGSHLMDSKEFSDLLEHMVDAAKEQGIETVPPEELARMERELEAHEKHNRR